ncbi:glycosyl hydrolase family 65 central catalytic domain-containing protein [Aspergillus cavernicola]|uniref:alpha,alpha-trehalase n=1 Tax=Aspergillus cavernicola TaxID=176166 RepID=A0ABR4HZR8_9EURO
MKQITKAFAAVAAVYWIPQVSAASSRQNTKFPGITWDSNAWTLTSTVPDNADWYAQSFVANGYIGSSFASTGPFPLLYSDTNGQWWMQAYGTFGTVAGFFDRQPITKGAVDADVLQYGWESVISGLPSWGPLVLDLGNDTYLDGTVKQSELSNVVLQQDFRKGSANYAYTWTPPSLDGLSLHPNRAYVQMNLTSTSSINATVVNILDGSSARRTDHYDKGMKEDCIYSAVRPSGVSNITGWTFAALDGIGVDMSTLQHVTEKPYISKNASTIDHSVQVNLQPHKPISLTKYVGIASNDAFEDPDRIAYNEMIAGKLSGFETAFQEHIEEWAIILREDSVTSFVDPATGDVPDHLMDRQITTVVAAAMLLMNTVSENAMDYAHHAPINVWGIAVCGLTADCYGGQQFWDQEIWMQPYLAATHPFEAKQISLSRTSIYQQALANIQTHSRSPSKKDTVFSPQAAIYPWSTGRDGNCTATTLCWDHQNHINGDIVKGFVNYWAAAGDDDFFRSSLLPITNSLATLYSDIVEFNSSSNTWMLKNMTDPDEYAMNVDNGAFTMALIQWTLRAANFFNGLYGQSQNNTWDRQSSALEMPMAEDTDITLEYSGMEDTISVKQADVILRIYPLSNHADYTIHNQRADLEYYADKQSQDGPGMTYATFSIDASAIEPSGCSAYTYDKYAWTPYARIEVAPNLPPQIPHIRLPIFYFHGWPIQAEMNRTHTVLTRLETPLPTANMTFKDTNITVRVGHRSLTDKIFQLRPHGTVVLKNKNTSANSTTENNVLQCRGPVWQGGRF